MLFSLRFIQIVLLSIITILATQNLHAKNASEEQCKKLSAKIERYTKLRQHGGSAKEMDRWHRRRLELKKQMSERGCR